MKIKLISFILLFISISVFSQEKREIDNTITNKQSDIYSYTERITNFLQLEQANQRPTNDLNGAAASSLSNNNVTIQQIGLNNRVLSNSQSQQSDLSFLQKGNNNKIESLNTIQTVSEQIIQNGNNNRVTNFSYGTVRKASLNVNQNGNNLIFEKFGTNALTNDLKFNFSGNNKSITIRSY